MTTKVPTYKAALSMLRYVADPYWPEQEQVITIRKRSGMDNSRAGEEKRQEKLSTYLRKIGMTAGEFAELEKKAGQAWYRINRNDEKSPIILPSRQLTGMLVHAATSAPAGSRINPDNLRSLIKVSDFVTNKTKADGKFSRFVVPKDGKGNPISNQRRFMEDEYIQDFRAEGTVEFGDSLKPDNVKTLLEHAIMTVGVGACRKMDYGRGEVVAFSAA